MSKQTQGSDTRPRVGGKGLFHWTSSIRGQTIVESALVLPIFFALLFGIFEFGRLVQSWATINHAVDEAARYAVTGKGYDAGTGVRESQITSVAKAASIGIPINDSATSSQPAYYHVTIRSSQSTADPNEANNAGGANDFVRVEVSYNFEPLVNNIFGNGKSYINLHAETLVMNEHFARPLGLMGELPATPLATWTPTPTPTPTGTLTPTRTPTQTGTTTTTATPTQTGATTQTATPTQTGATTQTATPTQVGTTTPSKTPTVTPTPSKTRTITPTPTNTRRRW